MLRGESLLHSRPLYLTLEPGAVCNLRCPFCATGSRASTLSREFLLPETFARIVDNLPLDSLFEVLLFNWGEPLLNPHLTTYIDFFARRGIRVVVHTNFSARDYDDAFMDNLIRSGLTHLVASVDGASQETYKKYRVGGDFMRVIGNLARLASARKRLRSETPQISYKMLLNRYNEEEVEDARRIAEELGVEFWLEERFGVFGEARDEWIADSVRSKYGDKQRCSVTPDADTVIKTECHQLWYTLVVGANGDVFPCCLAHTAESALGSLANERFEDIWNNEKITYLRRFVLDPTADAPSFPNLCARCSYRNCTYRGE